MFRDIYQGGPVVEIFSGQGKDPVAKWKLFGGTSNIHKEFNKEVKGYVYSLKGSSQKVKMQIPDNGKMALGLLQRFLVLQVNIPQAKDFSTEVVITDSEHLKKRLYFSTVHKEVSATSLHAKIPFAELKRNIWSSLCIDLVSFTSKLFKGFLTLDGITLSATCKVRRIFTMKTEPTGLSEDDMFVSGAGLMDLIPHRCRFPPDVKHVTQVLNMGTLQKAILRARMVSSNCQAGCSNSPVEERPRASSTTTKSVSGFSCEPLVLGCLEKNVESEELQLTQQDEVFTFLSQPHSPKQGQGDHDKMEMGGDRIQSKRGRRHEAQPEDDFIERESDEDKIYSIFQSHTTCVESIPTTSRFPSQTLDVRLESYNMDPIPTEDLSLPITCLESTSTGIAEPAGMVSKRCLSSCATPGRLDIESGPCGSWVVHHSVKGSSNESLSRRQVQEVKLGACSQHKEEDKEAANATDSSGYNLHTLSSLRIHGDDDDELRMLASLRREQEEDECRASGFSASQIHHCNVSISNYSDDTSTWTHVSTPLNQGHHYQKEMNPLRQSNPREWMDVLSPPIMPPSQQRRSGNTWNTENLSRGGYESVNKEENEDEYLNLLYDPCLNCYLDPKTGKYYELA